MKFGLFTCGYQRGALEQAFEDAVLFGYDYVELWGGYPHAYAPDLINGDYKKILDLIQKWCVPVTVFTPEHNAYPFNYMVGNDIQWKNCMDYLTTSLETAKLIGAESMLVSAGHGGNHTPELRKERLLKSIQYLTNQAEKIGVRIVLETLTPFESNTCTKLQELVEVLDKVSSPMLCGMCDVVPPFVQKEDPADYFRVLKDRMAHLHLVDSDGVSDAHLIPGEGIIDLKKVLSDIRDAGYDGTATIEMVTNYIDAPSMAMKLSMDRVKSYIR